MPGRSRPIPAKPPPGRAWPASTGPTPSERTPSPRRSIRGPSSASATGPRHADSVAAAGGVPAFTDDAEAVGLRFVYDNAETALHQLPEPFGGGLALLDYDGDGWLDVYCVQGGPFAGILPDPGDRLFHNRGDGTFEDVTDRSGIGRFPARTWPRRDRGRR